MKAELPKQLKGIVPFFEEIEKTDYRMDQSVGVGIAAVRKVRHGDYLNRRDFEAAEKLSTMCGKCFGVHLADWFQTSTSWARYVDYNPFRFKGEEVLFGDTMKKLGTRREIWPTRSFSDGAGTLFKVLKRSLADGSHFVTWLSKGGFTDKPSNCQRMFMLAEYLVNHCDAPKSCFGGGKWPSSRSPSRVLTIMLQHNYEM